MDLGDWSGETCFVDVDTCQGGRYLPIGRVYGNKLHGTNAWTISYWWIVQSYLIGLKPVSCQKFENFIHAKHKDNFMREMRLTSQQSDS